MSARQPHRTARRHPTAADRLLSLCFCALIAVPGLWLALGKSSAADVHFEFRTPAEAPKLGLDPATWAAFPKAAEAFFADRYGQRSNLLRLRAWIYWELLQASPSRMVARGEGDWIFYTQARVLDTSRGVSPLSEQQVDDWLDVWQERRRRLAELGIVHLVSFAPDKSAIYPEHLPWNHARRGQRRIDQLVSAAQARGLDNLLDLTAAVWDAKAQDRGDDLVYYPLGTHWTQRGALAAGVALVERLRALGATPNPLPLEPLRFIQPADKEGDSWAQRLYLDGRLHQGHYICRPSGPGSARELPQGDEKRVSEWRREPATGPHLLVMHDSYGPDLMPFLSMAAGRSRWEWRPGRLTRDGQRRPISNYDLAAVIAERPDVVVELWTERLLAASLPPADEPLDQPALAARFEDAAPALVLAGPELAERLAPQPGVVVAPSPDGERLRILHERDDSFLHLDLEGLPAGRELLVCLELDVRAEGFLSLRYPYQDGSRAYPVKGQHRECHALAAGQERLYLRLQAPRSGTRIELFAEVAPLAYGLLGLEVRSLPRDPR
jgi:hypothetical protein